MSLAAASTRLAGLPLQRRSTFSQARPNAGRGRVPVRVVAKLSAPKPSTPNYLAVRLPSYAQDCRASAAALNAFTCRIAFSEPCDPDCCRPRPTPFAPRWPLDIALQRDWVTRAHNFLHACTCSMTSSPAASARWSARASLSAVGRTPGPPCPSQSRRQSWRWCASLVVSTAAPDHCRAKGAARIVRPPLANNGASPASPFVQALNKVMFEDQ